MVANGYVDASFLELVRGVAEHTMELASRPGAMVGRPNAT